MKVEPLSIYTKLLSTKFKPTKLLSLPITRLPTRSSLLKENMQLTKIFMILGLALGVLSMPLAGTRV